MEIKARNLRYDESEEHLVRRLGGAVVVLWDLLPSTLQQYMIQQAGLIQDREETVQLEQQLQVFIRNRKIALQFDELRSRLRALSPGDRVALSYEEVNDVMPLGVGDAGVQETLWQIARQHHCEIDHQPDQRTVWFVRKQHGI